MKNKIKICFSLKFSPLLLNKILVKFFLAFCFFFYLFFLSRFFLRIHSSIFSNYQLPFLVPLARCKVNMRGTRTRSRAHNIMTETLLLVDGHHALETSGGPITFRHIAVQLSPSINHPAIIVRD